MKNISFFISFLFLHSYFCIAQGNPGDRIEAIKVAYITREINLTPDEAQKFWPVYNSYFAEIKQARKSYPDDEVAFEEQVVNIRKKYKGEFKNILNDDSRVNRVFTIENTYRDLLRNELLRRQQMKRFGPNGNNPPQQN